MYTEAVIAIIIQNMIPGRMLKIYNCNHEHRGNNFHNNPGKLLNIYYHDWRKNILGIKVSDVRSSTVQKAGLCKFFM